MSFGMFELGSQVAVNNDNSLLFKKLNDLTVMHRIIMTGVRAH